MATERFEPSADSPRAARMFVLEHANASPEDAERIALLVSELAVNAVLHAGTPYTVAALRTTDGVRVEVHDESAELPLLREASRVSETGRGLHLVEKFASRWGVDAADDGQGKTVWFEINRNT